MEQQEQGWSTTAKVTAVLAGVGALGAAAYFGLDLGDEAESVSEKFSGAWDTAVEKAGDISDGAVNKFGDAVGAAAEKIEGVDPSKFNLTSLTDVTGHPGAADTKGIGSLLQEVLEKGGEDAYEAVAKAANDAGIKIDGLIDTGESWIKENPYKTAAAATAIAGGTGYIAGRNANACEHGHAHA